MRCAKATWQLQLYLDKQLSLEEVRILETHLSTCPACKAELHMLEDVIQTLHTIEPVIEPGDLTAHIMQRVALDARQKEKKVREIPFELLRLSLQELMAGILLATVSMLGLIFAQPTLRMMLPIANGHDSISMLFINLLQSITTMNTQTLSAMLWIIGTLLGVWITLIVAGNEMRTEWYKAVMDRLPGW